MTSSYAQQAQARRDLRLQVENLDREDQREMEFIEWSPGRKTQVLYSMQDGMKIEVPQYMVMGAISKRMDDGRFAFTSHPHDCDCGTCGLADRAPAFKEGTMKCFLAEGSPERESGLLAEAGLDHLAHCKAVGLRSEFARIRHGQGVHPQSWAILQTHKETAERAESRAEQRKTTDAMLKMAASQSEKAAK